MTTEIIITDVLAEGVEPSELYRSMLDALNDEARTAGWPGVLMTKAGYDAATRIFQVRAESGPAPATLHLLKKLIERQKAESEGADG